MLFRSLPFTLAQYQLFHFCKVQLLPFFMIHNTHTFIFWYLCKKKRRTKNTREGCIKRQVMKTKVNLNEGHGDEETKKKEATDTYHP